MEDLLVIVITSANFACAQIMNADCRYPEELATIRFAKAHGNH